MYIWNPAAMSSTWNYGTYNKEHLAKITKKQTNKKKHIEILRDVNPM